MENLVWVIYLIDVLTQPMAGVGFMLFLCMIAALVLHVVYALCDKDNPSSDESQFINFYKGLPVKTVGITSMLLLLVSNLIPSQDTAYKMLAVYGVSEVANNQNVQELMGDGMDILKLTLKDYKEKLEKSNEQETNND